MPWTLHSQDQAVAASVWDFRRLLSLLLHHVHIAKRWAFQPSCFTHQGPCFVCRATRIFEICSSLGCRWLLRCSSVYQAIVWRLRAPFPLWLAADKQYVSPSHERHSPFWFSSSSFHKGHNAALRTVLSLFSTSSSQTQLHVEFSGWGSFDHISWFAWLNEVSWGEESSLIVACSLWHDHGTS